MLPVAVVYSGLITICVALVAVMRPLRSLQLGTRRRALLALALGVALVAAGMLLPARELRVTNPRTRLDEFIPVYQFHETHGTRVDASAARVYQAIHDVTAAEIRLFRILTTIRRFGRTGPESVLNAPEQLPILDVATRTTFVTLAEDREREVLVGTAVIAPANSADPRSLTAGRFEAISEPGYALAAMNFVLTPIDSAHTHLTTETRVYATDAATRRRFARYWRLIYPGSALIRRGWLRAVRLRAQRDAGGTSPFRR